MKLSQINKQLNIALAGETITIQEMLPFLDYAIDAINEKLNANYPVFSDLDIHTDTDYNYFPDKYIRMAVIPGAAWRY